MGIEQLCAMLKENLAAGLQESNDPRQREDLLIDSLYELSRSILPLLGIPKKSQEYQEKQAIVLDLISFIVIPLIKGAEERRGVAVLSEIGEGCLDPQLRKKFSVYAQELLAKVDTQSRPPSLLDWRKVAWGAGCTAVAAVAITFALSADGPESDRMPLTGGAALQGSSAPPAASYHTAVNNGAPGMVVQSAAQDAQDSGSTADRPAPEPEKAIQKGDQVTRVRVINNQVLVPVTLKNGGEAVRLELVLDTGATRTAIHEYLAGRLRIDLRSAKHSQAEVADGRMITSRSARVDSLVVGPFAMTAADVELIPYKGMDGMHDGLLGMDFLGKHRYQLDVERELIRWF